MDLNTKDNRKAPGRRKSNDKTSSSSFHSYGQEEGQPQHPYSAGSSPLSSPRTQSPRVISPQSPQLVSQQLQQHQQQFASYHLPGHSTQPYSYQQQHYQPPQQQQPYGNYPTYQSTSGQYQYYQQQGQQYSQSHHHHHQQTYSQYHDPSGQYPLSMPPQQQQLMFQNHSGHSSPLQFADTPELYVSPDGTELSAQERLELQDTAEGLDYFDTNYPLRKRASTFDQQQQQQHQPIDYSNPTGKLTTSTSGKLSVFLFSVFNW